MDVRPHAYFLVAATRRALELPFTMLNVTVPRGSVFRLDYILVAYGVTIEAGHQTSPNLLFTLYDSRGLAMNNDNSPVRFLDVTTPAGGAQGAAGGGQKVKSTWGYRIEYPPGAVISMRVTGMNAGPSPATISVTYVGQKGWGKR